MTALKKESNRPSPPVIFKIKLLYYILGTMKKSGENCLKLFKHTADAALIELNERGKQNMPRENFFVRAADLFDIPADTTGGLLHIEITGNRELLVENHKGIIELGENEILLNIGKGSLRVLGARLGVLSMNAEAVRISGVIEGVSFCSQEDKPCKA